MRASIGPVLGIALLTLLPQGCHKAPEDTNARSANFTGKWKGTFVGGPQKGSVVMDVGQDGSFTGSMINETISKQGTSSGRISKEGKISATYQYPDRTVETSGTVSINAEGHMVGNLAGTRQDNSKVAISIDLAKP